MKLSDEFVKKFRIGVRTLLRLLGNLRKTMAVLISPDTGLKSGIAIVEHGMSLALLVVVKLGIKIYYRIFLNFSKS